MTVPLGPTDDSPSTDPWPPGYSVRVPLPLHQPLWTFAILVTNALVWLAMTVLGDSTDPRLLVAFGAKYNPAIVAGEYWRLLTACFLHIGILHLAFNSYALFSFGIEMERHYGRSRFLALYLLSGVAGSVLSFLGSNAISAGASGAIFGLVGAMIVYFVTYREEFGQWGRRQLANVLLVAGYNLIWGFMAPGIDYWGHIGGLLAGLVLGWAFCPRYGLASATAPGGPLGVQDRYSRPRAWLVSLGVVLLFVALARWGILMRS